MNKPAHLAGAACFAAGIIYAASEIGLDLAPVPFVAGTLLGGLLPDIDTPKSYIGRRVFIISAIINKTLKHRYFFHSFLFAAIIGAVVSMYNSDIGIGLAAGVLSHLMLDFFDPRSNGVALFYPFIKKRIKIF